MSISAQFFTPLNAVAQASFGVIPTTEYLDTTFIQNFDETIDGDPNSIDDLAEFSEPFFNTTRLQQSES
jgi:hypothetical protein